MGEVLWSTCLTSPVFFTDRSNLVLLLLNILICVSCLFVCHAVLSVPYNLVGTCWEKADLLALLYVIFSYFHIVCLRSGDCIDFCSLPSSLRSPYVLKQN